MPRHTDVAIPKNTWVILTDSADVTITGVRVQNLGNDTLLIQARADTTLPSGPNAGDGAIRLKPGEILFSTDTLANLFPGVTSPLHLFGFSARAGSATVSHA
jgi:hypothetical protein